MALSRPQNVTKDAPWLVAGDVVLLIKMMVLVVPAWVLPQKHWTFLTNLLARVHALLRSRHNQEIVSALTRLDPAREPQTLRRQFMNMTYRELMQLLREYRPGGWSPDAVLEGREHLDAASRLGKGVILWTYSCQVGDILFKKILYENNIQVTHLRAYNHPYSSSRLGLRGLNPIRTRIEDRYLAGTVWLYPDSGSKAIRQLRQVLNDGGVVSVTAVGGGENSIEAPFLGGTLRLGPGPITLTRLTGAPVLPLFLEVFGHESYKVTIQPPLVLPAGADRKALNAVAGAEYGERLGAVVKRSPELWRGWFNRANWRPV